MSYNVIDELFYITLFDLDSFCHGCIGHHTNCGENMEWMLTNYSTTCYPTKRFVIDKLKIFNQILIAFACRKEHLFCKFNYRYTILKNERKSLVKLF